jgi:hypothetical protein
MHTLSISPTWGQELDLQHLNGQTCLSLATVQTMPCRPFVHGGQAMKLQLDLGQRR